MNRAALAIALALAAAAALVAAHYWHVRRAVAAAEKAVHGHYAGVLLGIAERTAEAEKRARAGEQAARVAIEKGATHGQEKIDRARADARRADAAAGSLRADLAHYRRAAASAAADPVAADAGPPAGAALDLLAELLGRADAAAGELAAFADLAHAAGLTCERTADELREALNRHAENP